MPDIRKTPLLDDFERPDENPLSGGGNWAQWTTDGYPLQLRNVGFTGGGNGRAAGSTQTFNDNWSSAWTPQTFSGDMEIWGQLVISMDAQDRAGLALLNGVGVGGTDSGLTGYLLQMEAGNPADGVHLYKCVNNGGTHMVPVFGYTPDPKFLETLGYYMLRLAGDKVQVWYSTAADAASVWSMILEVTDSDYRTDLSLCLNMFSGGDNPGWDQFGGGEIALWMPEFIRRPWRYQGRNITKQLGV